MLLGNDCRSSHISCKKTSKDKFGIRNAAFYAAFSLFAISLFLYSSVDAQVLSRPPIQKPYNGPNEVNEIPPMGVSTGGPTLKINGNPVNPLAGETQDLTINVCSGTKTWKLLKEFTPWNDVNRFGFYTDLGVGNVQTVIFSGPNSEGFTTNTAASGTIGLWLLNDTDGNLVFSSGDSYLFTQRSLTYGSGANEHQWFMVYDVSAYKGTGATYFFDTDTEDYTTTGDYDYLIYIDDDHTSSNFDHNDMILGLTCSNPCANNHKPVASCPGNSSMFVCNLNQICISGFTATDQENNIATKTVSNGTLSGNTVCFTPVVGANLIKFIVTDSCGKADTCQTTVTVTLNSAPDAMCPGNQSKFVCDLSPICIPGFTATDPNNNIATKTVSNGTLSGNTVCFTPVVGANLIKFIVTDSCGKADTCQTTVTVTLNSAPDAMCPGNQSKFVCDLSPICISGFSATDPNNNISTKTVSNGTLSGNTVCFTPVVGANLIKFIVTDSCGKADTCQTTVIVTLNSAPDAMCPGNQNKFVCDLSPICISGFTATDPNNNISTKTVSNGTLSGNTVCFTPVVGANVITFIVTDSCGKADTCQTTVTVTLNSAPDAMCPGNQNKFVCDLSPICISGFTATDPNNNISTKTVSNGTLSSGTVCFNPVLGSNVITFIVTDSCGKADTCQTTVTVTLNSPPIANCPGNFSTTVCSLAPICVSGFSYSDPNNNIASVVVTGGTLSGDSVCFTPVTGNNLITLIVTDSCGKADTCETTVNVTIDNIPPQFSTCPSDATFSCDAIPAPPTGLGGTDNCDPNPVVTMLSPVTVPGSCPQSYTLIRRWEIKDAAGNADTCEQHITVFDSTAPIIVDCPANTTVQCNNVPAVPVVTAVDNCDSSVTVATYLGETTTPGGCPQSYTLTRKWVATDACGNTSDTCVQVINVVDNTKPTFTNCPAGATVPCDAVPAPASPSATDNCDASVTVTYLGETVTPGSCPQSYTLTRKWRAVDDCGNADTCTQVLNVVDNVAPVIANCPANATVQCNNVPAPGTPTGISDNCDPSPQVLYLGETNTPGSCPQSYTLLRKWVAKDACGNTSDTCRQTITVIDNTKPTFADCPSPVTVQCNSIPTPASPSATDNCDSTVTVTYLGETIGSGNCPYTITRKWEARDDCGNADTCTQVITVIDNVKPTITNCPANATVPCNGVPNPATVTATDNCDPNPVVTYLGQSTTPGSCPQSYTLVRKWVARDICGNNSDTCVQTLTVIDNVAPVIGTCPANATVQCNAVPPPGSPTGVTDNCDPSPQVFYLGETNTPGSCPQSYTLLRKWVARDACGNTSDTCRQTITVVDNTKPTFTNCPANTTVQCNSVPAPASPTATDNCDATVTVTYLGQTVTPGSCPSNYTLVRRWAAIDDCGNADTCRQTITVIDSTTISLGADSTKSFGNVCDPVSGNFKLRNATGCSPIYWKVNNVPASQDTTILFSAGYCTSFNQTWTITAYDSCGRSDSYTVTITANVNCLPQASCPSIIPERQICSLGVTVCIPGTGFECFDQDGGATTTLNGQPYNAGDPICFTPNAFGPYTLSMICKDACSADTCVSTVNILQGPCPSGCGSVVIEKTHNTIQGQFESVDITIDSMAIPIGGFDILIEYDASALSLSQVQPGSFITGCGWEYFTYRYGSCNNCASSGCPSGSVRLIAIGETNNGPNHPSCFQMDPAQLAVLTFLVTNDRTFECQYVPIRFKWCDCGDNAFSSINGDSLYLSENVFDYYNGTVWTNITNPSAPFPSIFGANATCDVELGNDKPDPRHCIDFYNGGIDIVCADSIDDRGDINLNGVSNEVADAVLFSNYFVFGMGVFTVNPAGQIAATDVNADGNVLSVADLVYLIRVVIGDALPYSKVTIPVNVKYTHSIDGRLTISDNTEIGAASVIVRGQVEPVLLAGQMEMLKNFDGVNTRILVWSVKGNNFTGDFLQVNGEITAIEMATSDGNPVALNVIPTEFSLYQNYPNPFNPKTVISFSLPTASDYNLVIYNVNGQQVATFHGVAESAGSFEIEWDAANFASGIYLYKLVAGSHVDIKKMILLK